MVVRGDGRHAEGVREVDGGAGNIIQKIGEAAEAVHGDGFVAVVAEADEKLTDGGAPVEGGAAEHVCEVVLAEREVSIQGARSSMRLLVPLAVRHLNSRSS